MFLLLNNDGATHRHLTDAESVFIDIEHPDNWKKLNIIFMKSDLTNMKYKYDGKESDWINVSNDLMNKPSLTEPKVWVKVLMTFCIQQEYHLPVVGKEIHDIIYRPNVLLKKWFLPNAPTGMKYNPIYSMGKHRKRGYENIQYTKYIVD